MKYTHQQLLRIIESITIQENGKLTSCSKEPIRRMVKYIYQRLLRIIETITIQENGRLTFCSKESIPGMMKYTHQQLLRIIEKHNDPREWETHLLLKRIHPRNDDIFISAFVNITISRRMEHSQSAQKYSSKWIEKRIRNLVMNRKKKRHTHKICVLGDCFIFAFLVFAHHFLQHHHVMSVKWSFHHFWEEKTHVKCISCVLTIQEGPAIPNLPTTWSPKKEWDPRMSTTQQEASQIQHLPPDPFHPQNIRRTIKKEDKKIHQHHNKNQVNRENQIHTPCSIPPARQVEYPRSHLRLKTNRR